MRYENVETGIFRKRPNRFIAHVEIPAEIRAAFQRLQTVYGSRTREANPLFASRQ